MKITYSGLIYQWDQGISLAVDTTGMVAEADGVFRIHFARKCPDMILAVEIVDGYATIPSEVLQSAGHFVAYGYYYDSDSQKTIMAERFEIVARPKPPEYILMPTPVITYPELVDLVNTLEALETTLSNVSAQAETLAPGSDASAAAEITPFGLDFTFGIPRGEQGVPGQKGDPGEPGAKGDPGLGFTQDGDNYVLDNPNGAIEISGVDGVTFGSPVVLPYPYDPVDDGEAIAKGNLDAALAGKMDKANPTGTGALSINRKANTTVGDKSSCLGGRENEVTGYCATATGNSNIASGAHSFAEGQGTWGRHANSHAEGIGTETGRSEQHVFGRYNHKMATGLRVSGNGASVNNKKNAEFLDDNGNLMLAGDVYVGCAADSTGGNKVATESYVDGLVGNVAALLADLHNGGI